MKKTLKIEKEHEVLSLINDIAFTCVPAWYGATMDNLKMSIICPKVREGHEKMPLIIWICGGAYRVVDRAVWVPEMMYYARKGFVVASIEYRTSNTAMFPGALIDVKAAIRYLKAHAEQFCIDPEKVAIMGESAGGTMASLAGTTGGHKEFDQGDFLEYDSSVNAVVDIYGLVDISEVGIQREKCSHDVPPFCCEDWLGLDYTEEQSRKASARYYVSKDTPPTLILHGTADESVDIHQSHIFYETLQENGVESDFYILDGAEHGDDLFYQDEVKEIVYEFIKKALKI